MEKVLYDSKWAKKGILKVKDVIDEDGDLRYNNIKHKINNQAEIYLKLVQIKKAISKMWQGKIKTRTQNPAENYLIVEIKGKLKQLETKTLIQYANIKSRGEQIYEQIWGEIRWDDIYLEMYRKQHCDFDCKCIQDAVNTEVRMIKYGYSNGKCKFCEIKDETLEHLLYD